MVVFRPAPRFAPCKQCAVFKLGKRGVQWVYTLPSCPGSEGVVPGQNVNCLNLVYTTFTPICSTGWFSRPDLGWTTLVYTRCTLLKWCTRKPHFQPSFQGWVPGQNANGSNQVYTEWSKTFHINHVYTYPFRPNFLTRGWGGSRPDPGGATMV